MRRIGITALAVALLSGAPPAGAAPAEPLSHAGRWITDAEGRVVVMHGAAVVVGGAFNDPAMPERTAEQVGFTQADADLLAAQGFNVVRLGMFFRGYSPAPGAYDAEYLASFVRTQRQLARAGIFTVLDFHQDQLAPRYSGRGFPDWFLIDDGAPNGGQPFPQGYFANPALNRAYDNLWANVAVAGGPGLQDRFAEGWARVAAEFADEERLLGYDIFNEPWPGSAWPSCANPAGCPPGGFDQTALTDFSNRIIAAIRTADPRHVAFYEPNLQFDVGAATGHGRVADPNAGFSFHNYCLGAAPGLPQVPDPVGACERLGETLVFENAEAHARETGAALLMTEFGDTENAAIHDRVADLADRFMVSWTDWAYMGSTGQIKRDDAKPPTADNLRGERLDAVARAYPRVVSGTPRSFGYDEEAGTFSLVYSPEPAAATHRPVGDPAAAPVRFLAGSQTEVFVPRSDFPDGYGVEVYGAELRSVPGSEELLVASCEGADRIEVRVARGIGPARDCARQEATGGDCLFSIRGTRRADVLRGTGASDRLVGRRGDDRLKGRGGPDCLSGGRGADRIRAADGATDRVACGAGGSDRARVDGADRVRGCERVRVR